MPKPKPQPPKEASESDVEEEEEELSEDDSVASVDPVDFIKSLAVEKRRRVYALKSITKKYREARKKLNAEIDKLQEEFDASTSTLFEARRQIVNGEREVTEEEIAAGTSADESHVEEIPDSDEEDSKKAPTPAPKGKKSVKIASPTEDAAKAALKAAAQDPKGGIPGFWYTALANNEICEGFIGPKDQEALNYLTDITSTQLPNRGGFKLEFHFKANPFFENATLTKTYKTEGVQEQTTDDGDDGAGMISSEGCEIKWKGADKNLLVVIKQKKQRHKSGKGVRIITKEERAESFFWFFYPPYDPEEDEKPDFYPTYAVRSAEPEEDMPSWDEEQELDFEMGAAIHMNLVRRAAHYFSGKSIDEIAQGIFAQMGGDGDDEDEEEGEEEEEEEQEVQVSKKGNKKAIGGKSAAPKPAPKECKQQ